MINKDQLKALKKRIVKGTLTAVDKINESSVINEVNEIHINLFNSDNNPLQNSPNIEEIIPENTGKKNKPRISFSPNIE